MKLASLRGIVVDRVKAPRAIAHRRSGEEGFRAAIWQRAGHWLRGESHDPSCHTTQAVTQARICEGLARG